MAKIKRARWTPTNMWPHPERSMKIERQALRDASSSRAT